MEKSQQVVDKALAESYNLKKVTADAEAAEFRLKQLSGGGIRRGWRYLREMVRCEICPKISVVFCPKATLQMI